MGLRKNIADQVRVNRAIRSMKQDELAVLVGVSTQTISNIETLKKAPTLETVDKIALAFNIDVSELTKSLMKE